MSRVSSFNQHFHYVGKKAIYYLLKSIFRASAFRLPLVLHSWIITFTRLNIWTQVSVRWAAECKWFVPLCSTDHERPVGGVGGLRWPAEAPPLTWLRVAVVHRVAIQLQELLRLRLLLPVAAHGEGILAHLRVEKGSITHLHHQADYSIKTPLRSARSFAKARQFKENQSSRPNTQQCRWIAAALAGLK